jgi:hypothetical protein
MDNVQKLDNCMSLQLATVPIPVASLSPMQDTPSVPWVAMWGACEDVPRRHFYIDFTLSLKKFDSPLKPAGSVRWDIRPVLHPTNEELKWRQKQMHLWGRHTALRKRLQCPLNLDKCLENLCREGRELCWQVSKLSALLSLITVAGCAV